MYFCCWFANIGFLKLVWKLKLCVLLRDYLWLEDNIVPTAGGLAEGLLRREPVDMGSAMWWRSSLSSSVPAAGLTSLPAGPNHHKTTRQITPYPNRCKSSLLFLLKCCTMLRPFCSLCFFFCHKRRSSCLCRFLPFFLALAADAWKRRFLKRQEDSLDCKWLPT